MKLTRIFMVLSAFMVGVAIVPSALAQPTPAVSASEEATSPVGLWQTIDDKTGAEKSIVRIFAYQDKLYGRIMQINYDTGKGPKDLCVKCSGIRKTQPVLGMIFMWDIVKDPTEKNQWGGGAILDPKSGSEYSDKLTLSHRGELLEVLGYMAFEGLGRTQRWHRLAPNALDAYPQDQVATGSDLDALKAVQAAS